jgi:hypothetical protein
MKKIKKLLFQEHCDRIKDQLSEVTVLEQLHEELGLSVSPEDRQVPSRSMCRFDQFVVSINDLSRSMYRVDQWVESINGLSRSMCRFNQWV